MPVTKSLLVLSFLSPYLVSCTNTHSAQGTSMPIAKLHYIGETIISNQTTFAQTPVGGLSGIDYNATSQKWVVISDDRAERGVARAYTGTLPITSHHVGPFHFENVITFKQADGSLYPNETQYVKSNHGIVPDFESIRFMPNGEGFRYTSEGDRNLKFSPFIHNAYLDGSYVDELSIPNEYKYQESPDNLGVYDNLAFEGSSFTPDGQYYFVAMEAPLIQDGVVSSVTKGAESRVLKYDQDGKVIAQYVYSIDPLPAVPGVGKHADNGVSEMLAIDDQHLLMLERAGIQDATGAYHNYIRIYQTDLSAATNVNGKSKLVEGTYQTMDKSLLLSLNELDLPLLDNIEGISFGPTLENGQLTLVVISDNNFNKHEITQIIAFAIEPA
ncbi:esterase-like activity of phytase family protein [Psychromonas sp. PT13]|uniref:esterase-like activity of phytase family protein n=1 Tax=Psychromonas sp. PT13 TaxID=3439547 RepID=UPI003EBE9BA8